MLEVVRERALGLELMEAMLALLVVTAVAVD